MDLLIIYLKQFEMLHATCKAFCYRAYNFTCAFLYICSKYFHEIFSTVTEYIILVESIISSFSYIGYQSYFRRVSYDMRRHQLLIK